MIYQIKKRNYFQLWTQKRDVKMKLKSKNNKYENNASLVFKIIYLMLGFFNYNSLTANSTLLTYCSYGVTLIGVCYFLYRIVHFNKYKKSKGIIILFLFFLSYIVSSVVTIHYGVVSNIKALIWLGIQFFLLYAYDNDRTVDKIKKEGIIIGWIIIVYTFVMSLMGIVCLALMYNNYQVVNGVATITGFLWNRLWGFYSDPNYGAVISIISVLLSFFYIMKYKRTGITFLLIINIITEMFYVAFSDSRTAQVSMVAMFIWATVIFARKVNFIQVLKPILRFVVICVITITVVVSSFVSIRGLTTIGNMYLSSVTNPNSSLFYWFDAEKNDNHISNGDVTEDLEINSSVIGRPIEDMGSDGGDISNRRFAIWQSAVEVFKTKAVTGVSFRNIIPYALEYLPKTYIVNNDQSSFASMHNLFMDVLVSQGLLGISLFIIFVVLVLVTVFKKLYKLNKQDYIFYASILSVIVPIFVSSFFYSEILYINTSGSVIFWIALGYVMNLSDKLKEEKICVK